MAAEIDRRAAAPHREAGSITILALWTLAIIALLLAGASFATRAELRMTRNAVAASEARQAAEAGVELGIARLLRRRDDGVAVFDGTPEVWRDGTSQVRIAIIDEAGKIDLNEAPLLLLQGLLVAVGRPSEDALSLACNIVDWRGGGDARCPQLFAPRERQPAYRHRFTVTEQMAQLPGFDEALYERIADYVTVATRASAIDPLVAARPVLLALPGATPGLVDAFLASRAQWHDFSGAASTLAIPAVLPFVTTSPAREFTIRSIATAAGHARYRYDLLIRLTGRPASPYRVLAARSPPIDRDRSMSTAGPRVP